MNNPKHLVLSEKGRILYNQVKAIFLKNNSKLKKISDADISEDVFKKYIEVN